MTNVIDEIAAAAKRDDIPDFRAGDTLKVHVKVVEGNRSRVQVFQGVVHPASRVPASAAPSPSARSPSASVSSAPSPSTPRSSTRSRSSPVVTSAGRSCTTCATCAARLPRSRRAARRNAVRPGHALGSLVTNVDEADVRRRGRPSGEQAARRSPEEEADAIVAGDDPAARARPGAGRLIKTLFVQAFYIPSPSMEPQFVKNDRILVQKVSYWGGSPSAATSSSSPTRAAGWTRRLHRAQPPDPGPGELRPLPDRRPPGEAGHRGRWRRGRVLRRPGPADGQRHASQREAPTLPTVRRPRRSRSTSTVKDHLWVMGDNRSNSADSRGHMGGPGRRRARRRTSSSARCSRWSGPSGTPSSCTVPPPSIRWTDRSRR